MTENENVASTEEAKNEPVPNPYNMKKTWHTEKVMPAANVDSANSLFVEPRTPVEQTESEEPQETKQVSKDEAYKKPDYKKRYDDLKRHYDSKLNEFRQREQELIQEATASRPEYQAPKTVEELEQFKAQYPDVYDVVETVSHLQSEAKVEELNSKIASLQERESAALRKEAESELLFKQDMGITSEQKKQTRKKSKSSSSKAADIVSTKTTTIDATAEPKIWTQEEIANLSMDEFDRLEPEIDRAIEEGRVRG